MAWEKEVLDSKRVRSHSESYGLGLLMSSILTRRNLDVSSEMAFFMEEDEHYLHNPFRFSQMEKAVERVMESAQNKEMVLVFGDRDVDGITSTVLMLESLEMLGLDADWHVPVGNEDYGLNEDLIRRKAEDGVTLLIAVDCGITDFVQVELAASLGMDVLIFDHHLPREDALPAAYAIVNPKMPDGMANQAANQAVSGYPFNGLCAAAVVSKFQWALCLAKTPYYGQECVLVLAYRAPGRQGGQAGQESQAPQGVAGAQSIKTGQSTQSGQGDMVLEACRMRHFMEVSSCCLRESDGEEKREEFLAFIDGIPLCTYSLAEQRSLIAQFFGGADVYISDLEPDIAEIFPSLRGMSLYEIRKASRMARYFPGRGGLLQVLSNLVIALQMRKTRDNFEPWREGLDLVALGTLADMMPLLNENRILVRMGLKRINEASSHAPVRKAVRELLLRQDMNEAWIGSTEVSWKLAPLINACGRLGKAHLGVELFREQDAGVIMSRSNDLMKLNAKRRTMGNDSWNRILPKLYESMERLGGRMAMVADSGTHRGITGLLASRVQKAMGCNTVVISVDDVRASGSVRCSADLNALDWLKGVSSVLTDYGGHPRAGGFRLHARNLDRLEELSKSWLKNTPKANLEPIKIDAELSHKEVDRMGISELGNLIDRFEPYGEGFPAFTFLTRAVRVDRVELIGKPEYAHLKMHVFLGVGKYVALWWNAAKHYNSTIKPGVLIDLVYQVDREYWRGNQFRRMTVVDLALCDE